MIPNDVAALTSRGALSRRAQCRLGVEIVATYITVRRLLWRKDIRGVVEALRVGAEDRLDVAAAVRLGRRLSWPVRRTLDPLPWDSRCLMGSLVLLKMLAAREVVGTLVIGVQGDGEFSAHAWVEYGGHPLLPTLDHARLVEI